MSFEFKKKLCTLSVICFLSAAPVFADEVYSNEVLEGCVQEYKMKDLTPEYISGVEMLLNEQYNHENFDVIEKTAAYFTDITKKYYGKRNEKTAYAYLKLAGLYKDNLIPDKAFENLNNAQAVVKWNKKNQKLKDAVNREYAELYSKINQPYDAVSYIEKIPDASFSSLSELASKYKRIAEFYSQAGDTKNAKAYFNKAISTYKSDVNTNKYELMASYSELADISNPVEAKNCINSLIATANSFPSDNIGVRIDAQLKKLQNQNTRTKKELDALSALIKKNKNPFQEFSMAWLYISYYYEQNNPVMEKKYKDFVSKFFHDFDWSKVPENSLKFTEQYENAINSNFWNYEEAQKNVDLALEKIEPVKKYAPVMYSKFLVKGANVNIIKGDYDKAKKYLKDAKKALNKPAETPKYQLAELADVYSDFYRAQNDIETALKYNNDVIGQLIELKDEAADEVLGKYMKNADIYLNMDNKTEAAKYADKFLNETKNKFGKKNIRTYDAMFNVSNFYRQIDETKANELYKEVLSGLNSGKVDGVYPMLYFSVFITEAHKAVGNKKYSAAVKYAEKSLKYAHDKGQKSEAYDILSYSYSVLGNRKLSAKYLKLKASVQ